MSVLNRAGDDPFGPSALAGGRMLLRRWWIPTSRKVRPSSEHGKPTTDQE